MRDEELRIDGWVQRILDEHVRYCKNYSQNNTYNKRCYIYSILVGMIFFVSELYASNDISKHRTTKYHISRHQHVFYNDLIFWAKHYLSPQDKQSYHYGKKKENSLKDFKKRIHILWLIG